MSLTAVFSSSLSALRANEAGLRVASQNVANANTPGYARVDVQTSPRYLGNGRGEGVEVSELRRAADRFLTAATLAAESRAGAATSRADLLDRAQASFGDPASDTSTFAVIDRAFSSLTVAASDPSSPLQRSRALSDLQNMFSEISRVRNEVSALRGEAQQRISDATFDLNSLVSRVADLNVEIQSARTTGGDATSAENAQDQLLDRISTFLPIRARERPLGGVELRTATGELLVGDKAIEVRFNAVGTLAGQIEVVDDTGQPRALALGRDDGMLGGLLHARDIGIPEIEATIDNLGQVAADALNRAAAENTRSPAPQSLVGQPTGLAAADPIGASGRVVFGVTAANGALSERIEVDFDAPSLSVNGAAAQAIGAPVSIGALNAALTAAGASLSASVDAAGVLSLTAAGPAQGVVVRQDATTPSAIGGRGFADFFGLNALVGRSAGSGDWGLVISSGEELPFGRADLTAAIGTIVVSSGDGAGASALAAAKSAPAAIPGAGGLPATTDGVLNYAASVGGFAGRRAAEAIALQDAAQELSTIARERRDDATKVNLDEELLRLTQYQQAYAAAARVLETATQMLDTLIGIGR